MIVRRPLAALLLTLRLPEVPEPYLIALALRHRLRRLARAGVVMAVLPVAYDPASAISQDIPVAAFFDGIDVQEDGSLHLSAGYMYANPMAVQLIPGSQNFFSPAPLARNQPAIFQAGMHRHIFSVEVDPEGDAGLTWTLDGIEAEIPPVQPLLERVEVTAGGMLRATFGYATFRSEAVVVDSSENRFRIQIRSTHRRRSQSAQDVTVDVYDVLGQTVFPLLRKMHIYGPYYHRKINRGMNSRKAKVAVMLGVLVHGARIGPQWRAFRCGTLPDLREPVSRSPLTGGSHDYQPA